MDVVSVAVELAVALMMGLMMALSLPMCFCDLLQSVCTM